MKKIIVDGKEKSVRDEFEYFQPNDHIDGDCVIRALCKATGWDWKEAYAFAFLSTAKEQFMPNYKDGERLLYKKLGWRWHSHNTRKPRPTVAEFAQQHPTGSYVLSLSKHHVCVTNGSYWDIWDCGGRKIYGYWEKPKEADFHIPENLQNNMVSLMLIMKNLKV